MTLPDPQSASSTGDATDSANQGDPGAQKPTVPTADDIARLTAALNAERAGRTTEKQGKQTAETQLETARTNLAMLTTERDDFKTKYEALSTEVPTVRERATLADRYEAAHAAGLDLSWASRLQGTKKEEWEADAKTLAASLGGSNGRRQIPAPDPSLGHGSGTGRTSAGSVTSRIQEILAEQAAAAGTQR